MDEVFKFIPDLAREVVSPAEGVLSRTLYADDRLKVVAFGFAAGEELSEHTAAVPAVMHYLSGEAEVTLGEERKDVGAGAWMWMPARLPHSVRARTPVTMILLLLK